MFGFCRVSSITRRHRVLVHGWDTTMAIHLHAGAVFCSWFDLYVIPFIRCFLLFVIVVAVFLCCPEVQASVQDFVRDGKRNYLLQASKMPVMSKICLLALRFLSLLLVPVLGAGVKRQLRVTPRVALCPSWCWLWLPSVLASKCRGFDPKGNLPHWARVLQENFAMERGLCLLENFPGCPQRQD